MDPLRKLYLLVIFGILFMSGLIGVIFFIINKCLFRQGKHRISQLQKQPTFKSESNKYHTRDSEAAVPPLPPRTQFLTAAVQSYENLAEVPDYEQSTHDYEQDAHDYEEEDVHDYEETTDQQADYVKVEDEPDRSDPNMILAQSYENLAEEADYEQEDVHDYEQEDVHDYEQEDVHDYEESTDQQPDYVKVEDEPDPNMILAQSYENLAEEADYVQGLDEQPDYVKVEDEAALLSPSDPAADNISSEDYDDIGEENQDEEDYDDVA